MFFKYLFSDIKENIINLLTGYEANIYFFGPKNTIVAKGRRPRETYLYEGPTNYMLHKSQSTTYLLYVSQQMQVHFQEATRHLCRTDLRIFLFHRDRTNIK